MMLRSWRAHPLLGLVLATPIFVMVNGCAHDPAKTVTITRLIRDDPPGRVASPICASLPTYGPEEMSRAAICIRAAKAKGVRVATDTDPSCLKAFLTWQQEAVGSLGECSENMADAACRSGLPFRHILMLDFSDARGLAIESQITMPSRSRTVDDTSVNALCSAAFFRYPRELEHKRIEAAVGR